MLSPIETMIERKLQREKRGGVDHFVTGQLEAKLDPDDATMAELSYVDGMGHGVFVLCEFKQGEWIPVAAFRGGQTTISQISGVKLSERAQEALQGLEAAS